MQSKNDVIWDQNLSKLFLDIKTSMNKKLQTVNLQIIRYDYILVHYWMKWFSIYLIYQMIICKYAETTAKNIAEIRIC